MSIPRAGISIRVGAVASIGGASIGGASIGGASIGGASIGGTAGEGAGAGGSTGGAAGGALTASAACVGVDSCCDDDGRSGAAELALAIPDTPEVTGDGEARSAAAAALTVDTVCPAGSGWVTHQMTGAATMTASPAARPVAARRRDNLVRAAARSPEGSVRASDPGRGAGHRQRQQPCRRSAAAPGRPWERSYPPARCRTGRHPGRSADPE